jgi:hypothetical protein
MFIDSPRRRIQVMNSLWQRAASDLTLDHVNHVERPGILPLGFSFNHFMRGQDQAISAFFLGRLPLFHSGDWARKTQTSVDLYGQNEPVATMEQLRFGDWDAWQAYQSDVIARTDTALETLTAELLAEVAIPPLRGNWEKTFCAMVVGPGNPVRKLEVLECFVYQHGLRRLGEVEHGRALAGLPGGMTA